MKGQRLTPSIGVHVPAWVDSRTERCMTCGAIRKVSQSGSGAKRWELNGVPTPRCGREQ